MTEYLPLRFDEVLPVPPTTCMDPALRTFCACFTSSCMSEAGERDIYGRSPHIVVLIVFVSLIIYLRRRPPHLVTCFLPHFYLSQWFLSLNRQAICTSRRTEVEQISQLAIVRYGGDGDMSSELTRRLASRTSLILLSHPSRPKDTQASLHDAIAALSLSDIELGRGPLQGISTDDADAQLAFRLATEEAQAWEAPTAR
ncbi:hypothetical protein OH76DRAFT_989662 [Lentinus brumalis]|uniref:Uncharacterized protein n=1 Tax=Lentinus brumalis TaxID=2498619 RepID=A0A371DQ90_9APHY|nr:hypothetical protein OH76DRAFT_989662 [Polyporus brumalis]